MKEYIVLRGRIEGIFTVWLPEGKRVNGSSDLSEAVEDVDARLLRTLLDLVIF